MQELRARVRDYYSGTLDRHGPTPLGVDWPNAASQYLRFVQLLKIVDFKRPCSLNDFGCGYGALLEFLAMRHGGAAIDYRGVDISPTMIAAATRRWSRNAAATFVVGDRCGCVADYSIASGIFNVRLGQPVAEWEAYLESILEDLHASSRAGFAVNFMLPHDEEPCEDALYRSEPQRWIEVCTRLGSRVELIGQYGLREFTLLSRRTPSTAVRPAAGVRRKRPPSPPSGAAHD